MGIPGSEVQQGKEGEEPGKSSRVSGNKAWSERTQCALSARRVKRDGGRGAGK